MPPTEAVSANNSRNKLEFSFVNILQFSPGTRGNITCGSVTS